MKACPSCAEQIQDAANRCRFCGYSHPKQTPRGYALTVFGVVLIVMGGASFLLIPVIEKKLPGFDSGLKTAGAGLVIAGLVLVLVGGLLGRRSQ